MGLLEKLKLKLKLDWTETIKKESQCLTITRLHTLKPVATCNTATHAMLTSLINIKIGGVHQWYMAFGQQCSISGVFRINFKIKGLESKTKKGVGAPCYHLLVETLIQCV